MYRNSDAKCKTCKNQIKRGEAVYKCISCGLKMHMQCAGLEEDAIKVLSSLMSNVLLLCKECVNKGKRDQIFQNCTKGNVEGKIDDKLNKSLKKMENSLIKQINQKLEAALAGSDAKTEKSMEKILEEKIVKKVVNVQKTSDEQKEVHHDILKTFRIQGIPEDLEKTKDENLISLNENIKDIFDAIEVNTTVENVRRLGRFDKERSKPGSVLVTVPKCWDTWRVLAKAREKLKLLSDRVFYVLPSLTKAESEKENMCLKKRREMIENGTPATELKITSFGLLHNGTKVDLEEPSN